MVMPSRCTAPTSLPISRLCSSSFRGRLRLVVEAVGLQVFGDVGVDEPDLAALARWHRTSAMLALPRAGSSPRCRSAAMPASNVSLDRIVEARPAVVGDDLAAGVSSCAIALSSAVRRGSPARTIASRRAASRRSATGTIGKRDVLAHAKPSMRQRIFRRRRARSRRTAPRAAASAGPDSSSAFAKSPRKAGSLELGAELRRDVGGDGDAAVPAMRHEAERRARPRRTAA